MPGFEGSQPVRFGNGAQGQLQLDIFGEVIDCLFQAREHGIADGPESDQLVRMIAGKLAEIWEQPDAGIWESRGEPRQHTYSKVMCWVAFHRARPAWFKDSDASPRPDHYRDLAGQGSCAGVREGLERPSAGSFVRAFDDPALDAALLRLPLVGFLPANDPRMSGDDRRDRAAPVRRGPPAPLRSGCRPTMVCSGSEGAFVAANFWLADALHMQGRVDAARALFERLLGRANDLGLLAEELEIGGDAQLGNFPQALSHLALVRTAQRLGGNHGDGGERV